MFTGHLIQNNLKSTTVKTYISAIKGILAENNIPLSEDHYLLTSLTKACKLHNDEVITRLPIEKGMLGLLLNQITKHFSAPERNQPYLEKLYKALLVTGYYGMLRVGELTKGPHVVLAQNVFMGENKEKVLFVLKLSKTHTKGDQPQLVKIAKKPPKKERNKKLTPQHLDHNPFEIIDDFIKARPEAINANEQFFIFADHSEVKLEHLRKLLHTLIQDINLQPHLYNVHSLRIG